MAEAEFALLRLDAAYRERHGIPDAYVPASLPLAADLPPDALLRLVQEHAASWPGWQTLEPLWDRLIARLDRDAPPDPVLDVEGANWSLRVGPVDLGRGIVTLQRSGHLLAAVAPRPDGRLAATAYRPLDARALRMLTGIGVRPAPDGTVAMRPNNWEYALDQSAGMGQAYASERGVTYLSYWEFGLGVSHDGTEVENWHAQRSLIPRPASSVAAELRAFARWPEPPALKLSLASKPPTADAVTVGPTMDDES